MKIKLTDEEKSFLTQEYGEDLLSIFNDIAAKTLSELIMSFEFDVHEVAEGKQKYTSTVPDCDEDTVNFFGTVLTIYFNLKLFYKEKENRSDDHEVRSTQSFGYTPQDRLFTLYVNSNKQSGERFEELRTAARTFLQ